MSKKARAASAEREPEPLTGGFFDLALVVGAIITVALVALWFKLDVMRVFDVPKALALKVGGCGLFLAWLLYGLFGPGYPWRSIRAFAAPVFALTAAVAMSTLFSIDVPMSFYGVYERQFGLQGFLGCIGIFVVTATCLRSRRGAIACLAALSTSAGVMGSYSLLQSKGLDPFGFFPKPHNKVYSTLGNANFAGNALALIFPIAVVIAVVSASRVLERKGTPASKPLNLEAALIALLGGAIAFAALQLAPGLSGGSEVVYKAGVALSILALLAMALLGSAGPAWAQLQSSVHQKLADAAASGALASSAIFIGIGIITTRTRGAWVGTLVMIFIALLVPTVYPGAFTADPRARRGLRTVTGALLAILFVGGPAFVALKPDQLYSVTIRSVFHAFDSEHTVLKAGQGSRRYLWSESPRVLFEHKDTLERQYRDRDEYAKKVRSNSIEGLDLPASSALSEQAKTLDTTWRSIEVWLFGIGIETYRYAFMSHKSKMLEALDPMTNHDNPHNNYLYVLGSFGIVGLAAYLWLLQRLLFTAFRKFTAGRLRASGRVDPGPPEDLPPAESYQVRGIAYGVVLSFFSYAVYSIAGFDSVCSSVFFYFLLGSAAVFFDPNDDEPRRNILVGIRRQWAVFRGRDPAAVPNEAPMGFSIATAAIGAIILVMSISGALTVHAAEQAFVGDGKPVRDFRQKLANMARAIEINPYESHYKQSLGSAYTDIAHQFRSQAMQLQREGKTNEARAMAENADAYSLKAEAALYAALDHAWAPENIFISLFQLYYGWRKLPEAEYALKRGLEHSPHLGAVRANLAILELEREGYADALADCKWVLEVDSTSEMALRTCGRASYFLGDYSAAKTYLDQAVRLAPNDPVLKGYINELNVKAAAATASTAAHP